MVYFSRPGGVCVEQDKIFGDESIGWPPSPKGWSTQPPFSPFAISGGVSRIVNDLGLTDTQVLAGSKNMPPWFTAMIDWRCKTILVLAHVHLRSRNLTDEQEIKLIALARQGIAKFWSRSIELNGAIYGVDVRLDHSAAGMDIWLEVIHQKNYKTSYNSRGTGTLWSLAGTVVYYQPTFFRGNELEADQDFELVVAHELGHSVLSLAGGKDFSWGHKGTSNNFGGDVGEKLSIPKAGEIDLMKYYDYSVAQIPEIHAKSIASESDVKNLIYVSRHD
jgi:hypothetical protein